MDRRLGEWQVCAWMIIVLGAKLQMTTPGLATQLNLPRRMHPCTWTGAVRKSRCSFPIECGVLLLASVRNVFKSICLIVEMNLPLP